MERLKMMKDCLIAQVEAQMENLEKVDTHELGEAIDIIKDLEEAMYYCSIVKAMEEKESSLENDSYTKDKDLEKYLQELATDISEIITTATPEEKQMLHRKLSALTTKVEQNV